MVCAMPKDMISHAFLGVEKSLGGRRWVGPSDALLRQAEALGQATGHPDALCRILAARGVAPTDCDSFLAPTLRDLLPDPTSLRDMGLAVDRLIVALNRRERIAIFADYDVDGGASAALLLDWLRQQGHDATLYIPDRIDEGYGPNAPAMAELAARHDLIVCVDCGTLSHDAIAAAQGADVVVIDHHLGGETLPDALAIVNPNRQDESGDLTHLCAAAVTFLVLVEANKRLRKGGVDGPNLLAMLDLVGLATVADVAPLVGVNRALVRQGLRVMMSRSRPGLAALADVAGIRTPPSAYHLGYILGPRVNAGGRIGQADLGARCLSCTDPSEAGRLASELDRLNQERRQIERDVLTAALAQVEARGSEGPLVWAAEEGWHPGVVGIVASRLKEETGRPAIVIGFDGSIGKGSGRSVSGVDLGHAVQKLAAEGLLLKGGGHRMAAGLTVAKEQLEPAMSRLGELLAREGAGTIGASDLSIDAPIMPGAATVDLLERIETAGPFGQSAPAPRFALPDTAILHAKIVGDGHLKLTLGDGLGTRLDAIAFGKAQSPLGEALLVHRGARFHLAGRLEINHWNGRQTVQLRLEDAARSEG